MAEHQPEKIADKSIVKVGVIIVHGIGETKRFEFLEGETRKIIDAIIARYDAHQLRRHVTPTLTTGASDQFLGAQSNWVSGAEASLHVLSELDDKVVDIAFHEVWWADINETLTLGKQFRFWAWGLSLAGIATHNTPFLPGAAEMRRPANAGRLTWWNRIRMAYVSVLFGFSACSIALINLILKRLIFRPILSTDIIINYLSAVKLYSQDKRAGGSTMDGPDEPPRAAIRRRMIRAMIGVAMQGYDRWYILAHSQGTVVAWNGLMETEKALPNYLDQQCWNSLRGNPLRASTAAFPVGAMMPNRPLWLGDTEIIDRDALFANFRGLLTYGSPLERFSALWSAMVPINKREDPFRDGTEWVNVYDPTDPVATKLVDFDPSPPTVQRHGHTKLKPHNFPCRSSPILLLSHICYLTASRLSALRTINDSSNLLVNQVADWLVLGGSLAQTITAAPKDIKSFWMPPAAIPWRAAWRTVQWGIVGIFLTVPTLLSINFIILPLLHGGLAWLRTL